MPPSVFTSFYFIFSPRFVKFTWTQIEWINSLSYLHHLDAPNTADCDTCAGGNLSWQEYICVQINRISTLFRLLHHNIHSRLWTLRKSKAKHNTDGAAIEWRTNTKKMSRWNIARLIEKCVRVCLCAQLNNKMEQLFSHRKKLGTTLLCVLCNAVAHLYKLFEVQVQCFWTFSLAGKSPAQKNAFYSQYRRLQFTLVVFTENWYACTGTLQAHSNNNNKHQTNKINKQFSYLFH